LKLNEFPALLVDRVKYLEILINKVQIIVLSICYFEKIICEFDNIMAVLGHARGEMIAVGLHLIKR